MTDTKAVWTTELIAEAVAMYIERIETHDEADRPDHTIEVTESIAEELGFKANSVRVRLSKAKRPDGKDVYVRKVRAKTATTGAAGATGTPTKRVSKADAQAELTNALKQLGAPISEDLASAIDKLTGKAAQLLAASLTQIED